MKLACIPAYNEERTIADVVKSSLQFVDKVIVCDDGSKDDTAKIAQESGAHIISHTKNKGYGAAITTLFEQAKKENVDIMITLDGDGQHDPKQIPLLIDTLVEHNLDVVVGSRFLQKKSDYPRYRKAGIKIITSASNIGTDLKVTDAQSGFRVYSKKAIESIKLSEQGMSISTEILQKISNKGLSFAEVPITVSYQSGTSSQRPAPQGIVVLMNTLKFISVKHPIPFYGFPGIAFLIIAGVFGYNFLDAYLFQQEIFIGSLLASVALFIVGSIMIATAIILFSMSTLMKGRQ